MKAPVSPLEREHTLAWLGAIVESSDDAIVATTPDEIITSWNPAAERLYGYSAAEAVGQKISLIIPPDRVDEQGRISDQLRRGEPIEALETVRVRKNGTRIDISLSLSPMRNQAGALVGQSRIGRDITERRRAQAERERDAIERLQVANERLGAQNEELARARRQADAEHQRYQELFELAPDGYLVTDRDGIIVESNRAAATLLDVPEHVLIGTRLFMFVSGEEQGHLHTLLSRLPVMEDPVLWDVDIQPRRRPPFPASVRLSPSRDARGRLAGARWGIRNITHRRAMEAALRDGEARLASVIGSAMDAIIAADAGHRIVLFNPAAERMFRCPATQAVGRPLDQLVPGLTYDAVGLHETPGAREARRAGALFTATGVRDDGDRFPVEASVSRTDVAGEKRLTVILRDVADRVRAEGLIRTHQEALEARRDELRVLAAALLTVGEAERERISHALHDDVSQRLAVLAVEIQSALAARPRSALTLSESLRRLEVLTADLADDVHRLEADLHPRMVHDLGLRVALEAHAREVTQRTGMSVKLRARGVPASIPRAHALCLYRIAQEALQEVVESGRRTPVCLTLAGTDRGVGLCVADGRDRLQPPTSARSPTPQGPPASTRRPTLVSMEERIRLLHGRLAVRPRPRAGAHVHAWLPLPASTEAGR